MAFFSFLAKLPWGLIISKTPDIMKAVKTFQGEETREENLEEHIERDFLALEKLVIEQAKITAGAAREVCELRAEMEMLKKKVTLLVSLTIALMVTVLILVVTTIAMAK